MPYKRTVPRICRICCTDFLARGSAVQRGGALYCSPECRVVADIQRPRPSPAERIASKINPDGPVPAHCPERGPCAMWTGTLNDQGYAVLWVNGQNRRVSRLVWEHVNGPIPDGLNALHHCDNPPCVQVDADPSVSHIFLGTHGDNAKDKTAKGRGSFQMHPESAPRESGHALAKLNEIIVAEMKQRVRAGERQKDVAAAFSVRASSLNNIMQGRSWKHVP